MYNKIYYFCQNTEDMKRVIHLIDIVDPVLIDKLIYLDKLLNVYAKFMQDYRYADVRSDGKNVIVRFTKVNMYGYTNWTEREFSVDDLPERIMKYKAKVKYEFKNRHNNVRLLREKEITKWRKVIENAKIQMSE